MPQNASVPEERSRWRAISRRPSIWIGAAVLLAAAVLGALRARGPVVETAMASRTDLEQHLVVNGRVRVVTRVERLAEVSGRVLAVRAVEGRRVKAGDLLVQLDDAEARAAVAQAQAAVGQAEARLAQLREVGAVVAGESSREAATNLSRAESELARVERLAAAGAVAQTDLEEARRQVELAAARKAAADVRQVSAAPAGAESRVALAAVVESRAALAAARARLAQTRVATEQDGVVLRRAVEPGDTVQAGQALVELAADGETELVIEPDERHLGSIRLGQPARASADAYADQIFDAEVSHIAPAINPDRGSVEVRLRVPRPPPFLKPDMTVSVDLTVATAPEALTVPSDAVGGAAGGDPWVLVVENGRVARRRVTLGIRGRGSIEIAAGVAEGAEVVRVADPALADGGRVRARREAR
jgi:HlyD family secretion protein